MKIDQTCPIQEEAMQKKGFFVVFTFCRVFKYIDCFFKTLGNIPLNVNTMGNVSKFGAKNSIELTGNTPLNIYRM